MLYAACPAPSSYLGAAISAAVQSEFTRQVKSPLSRRTIPFEESLVVCTLILCATYVWPPYLGTDIIRDGPDTGDVEGCYGDAIHDGNISDGGGL